MKILVVSKLSIPAKDRTLPAWQHLRSLGHTVTVEHPDTVSTSDRPDALIVMGNTVMEEGKVALKRWPGVPLYPFQWDTYSWIWEPGQEGKKQAYHPMRGQEYDYIAWGHFLCQAKEVWVPSRCTGLQVQQWWGVENWHVILSSCPWWDHEVKDGGYALCTLRHLPDAWDTVFEECCAELGIPFLRTDHNLDRPGYERAVAECRFLVSHYQEASTGGLTLMEGYRLRKPVLLSDSPWNGASEYLKERASYFNGSSRDSFKQSLKSMWESPPTVSPDHKEFIEREFSDEKMVEAMMERMKICSTSR